MATTSGTAIVWGVSTTNMSGFTAAVSNGYTFTGEDLGHEADKVELKDRQRDYVGLYLQRPHHALAEVLPKRQQRLTHIATNTGRDGYCNIEH